MNIFIDTNVFLSFFHYSNENLEELHKLLVSLKKGSVTLILPEQVKNEFNRNREAKIIDAMRKLKDQKIPTNFPNLCKNFPGYEIVRQQLDIAEKLYSELIGDVDIAVRDKTLAADKLIAEIFAAGKTVPVSTAIYEKARRRVDLGNPPGKNGSLGDAVNWEILISSQYANSDLYFVSGDGDFYSSTSENQLKDFLADEFVAIAKRKIYVYRRISDFFRDKYPDIKMAVELEKQIDIDQYCNSGSFQQTHSAIARLEKYEDFDESEVERIAESAFSNDQIRRLRYDADVQKFLGRIAAMASVYEFDDLVKRISDLIKPLDDLF